MKKLMPVLMTSALVAPFAAQAEGPIDGKVYGKINVAYISEDVNGTSDKYLESHASRFGFKGKTDLENGLSVVYQLEYEVNPTENAASTTIFKTRNSFVGLGTVAGTFVMGTHDTPLKASQGKVDLFNDLTGGDIKSLVTGEVRANDVFAYISPELAGFSAFAATTQYEGNGDDATSISVAYNGVENLYVAIAADSKVGGMDTTRISAQYDIKSIGLKVGALFNDTEKSDGTALYGTTNSADSMVVSAAYKIDAFTLKGQYGSGDEKSKGRTQTSIGVDYKLGKKSKVYVYTSSLDDDSGLDESFTGLGIEHKF